MKKPYVIMDWLGNYYLIDENELSFTRRTVKPVELYIEAMAGKKITSMTADEIRKKIGNNTDTVVLYSCEHDVERRINIKHL